jgi:PPM family protein phosphatase
MEITNIYYLHEIGGKKNQEDYLWPVPGSASTGDRIFIVCDGVGGSEKGEVASRIVSESVGNALLKSPPGSISLVLVNQLLNEAQVKLAEYAKTHGLSLDMATTFSLLYFTARKAFISWCGDSRVYHLRKGAILFKTDDHSLVNSLVRSGEITEEEARVHPQKNLILKAIRADNGQAEAEGHWIEDIEDGDYFLACTDGLLENIGERDLKFLLEQNDKGIIDLMPSFQQFCLDKTKDNYSMYLVRVQMARKKKGLVRALYAVVLLLVLAAGAGLALRENYFNVRTLLPARFRAVMPPGAGTKDTPAAPKKDTVVFYDKTVVSAPAPVDTVLKEKREPLRKDSPVLKKSGVPGEGTTGKKNPVLPKANLNKDSVQARRQVHLKDTLPNQDSSSNPGAH